MILRRHLPAIVAGAAAAALVLLTLAVATRAAPLVAADAAISATAHRQALAHPAWRSAMYVITTTANTTTVLPLAAIAVVVLLFLGRRRQVYLLLSAVAGTTALRLLILDTIQRPRPADRLAPAAGWSFPSGHTTAAATTAGLLIIIGGSLLPGRRSRTILTVGASLWAVSVGVSRVALVVHWPTDVLGAGLLVTAVLTTLNQIFTTRAAPEPSAEQPPG
jgi:undecaprenyl-diphosphatase